MSFRSSSVLIGVVVLAGCNSLTGVSDLEVVPDDAAVETGDTATVVPDSGVFIEQDTTVPEQDSAIVVDTSVETADACEASGVDDDMDLESPTAMCGTDCNDRNRDVNSKQTKFFASPYATSGFMSSFDYNCDGVEEQRFPDLFTKCTLVASGCSATQGWVGTVVPACGKSAKFVIACTLLSGMCYPQQNDRVQQCR